MKVTKNGIEITGADGFRPLKSVPYFYWSDRWSQVLRQKDACAFFPEAEYEYTNKNGAAGFRTVFRLMSPGGELCSTSRPISESGVELPEKALDAFLKQLEEFHARATPDCSQEVRNFIRGFELPDPRVCRLRDCWRITKDNKLIVLWGFDAGEGTTILPMTEVSRAGNWSEERVRRDVRQCLIDAHLLSSHKRKNRKPGRKHYLKYVLSAMLILFMVVLMVLLFKSCRATSGMRPHIPGSHTNKPVENQVRKPEETKGKDGKGSSPEVNTGTKDKKDTEPVVPKSGDVNTKPVVPKTGDVNTEPVVPKTGDVNTEPVVPKTGDVNTEPVVPKTGDVNTKPVVPKTGNKDKNVVESPHGADGNAGINGLSDTLGGLPGIGGGLPGIGGGLPGSLGSGAPGIGGGFSGIGGGNGSVPGTASVIPGSGSGLPGSANGEPGSGGNGSVPGTASGLPGTASVIPGSGSGLPGTASVIPGSGSGLPGSANGEPGSGGNGNVDGISNDIGGLPDGAPDGMSLPESTLLNTAQKVKEKAGKAHFAAEVGRVIADKALELAKGAFTSNNPEDARLIENIADDALSEANLAKNDADQAKEEAARIRFIAERALLDSPGSQDAMDAKTIADGAGIEADNARVEAEKAIAIADIARAYAKSVAATAPSASAPLTTAGANANRPAANTNPAGTPPAEFAPLTTTGANANRPAANTNPAGTNPTADANANRLAVNGNPAGTPPAAGTNANRPAANGNPAGTTPAESAPLTTTGANSNRPAANTNPAVNSLDQDSIPSQEQRTVEPLFTIRNTGSSDKAFQVICINSDLPFKVTQWSSPQFFDEEGRNISNLFSCSSVEMLDSTEGCFDWEQRHIGAYRLTLSAVVKFKLPDGQTREVQVSPRNFEFFNGMVH